VVSKSELYMLGWVSLLYTWLIISKVFLPEKWQNLGGIAGFLLIVFGMFLQDYIYMYQTMPYPYIRAIIRPSNKVLHLFVKGLQEVSTIRGTSSIRLTLAWPVKMAFYGKVQELVVNLEWGSWQERVKFHPGRALFMGWGIKHAQTEQVVLYEPRKTSFDLDHADPIPVFILANASGDYYVNMPRNITSEVGETG